ncbi:MAG TPA: hypothetical protein VFB72_13555 [Verrucomicrobiae bacterium]|nr:hypothetical protein [Verrucomicrobiae bacterium]
MKKRAKYPKQKKSASELKETPAAVVVPSEPMVRTQIYLSKAEHDFLQAEARRREQPMAAIIRGFIDEKMEIPDDAWTNNPIFKPWPKEAYSGSDGHEDAGINLDHYLYGVPKDWIKVKGEWVEAPPLPKDYYENRESAEAYDKMIREMDESQ